MYKLRILALQTQWGINTSFPTGGSQEMAPSHAARGDAAAFSLPFARCPKWQRQRRQLLRWSLRSEMPSQKK